MTELRSTAAGLETRVAAATETEQRALQNAPEHTVDGAERERRELRSRSAPGPLVRGCHFGPQPERRRG